MFIGSLVQGLSIFLVSCFSKVYYFYLIGRFTLKIGEEGEEEEKEEEREKEGKIFHLPVHPPNGINGLG